MLGMEEMESRLEVGEEFINLGQDKQSSYFLGDFFPEFRRLEAEHYCEREDIVKTSGLCRHDRVDCGSVCLGVELREKF